MTTPQSRNEELEHAGAVCGWFTAHWSRRGRPSRRRGLSESRQVVLKALADPSEQLHRAVSDYLTLARPAERPSTKARTEQAIHSFVERVSGLRGVDGVAVQETREEVRIWTIMNEHERDAEDRVYSAEAATLDEYQELLFDFRILFRHGRSMARVLPSSVKPILETFFAGA